MTELCNTAVFPFTISLPFPSPGHQAAIPDGGGSQEAAFVALVAASSKPSQPRRAILKPVHLTKPTGKGAIDFINFDFSGSSQFRSRAIAHFPNGTTCHSYKTKLYCKCQLTKLHKAEKNRRKMRTFAPCFVARPFRLLGSDLWAIRRGSGLNARHNCLHSGASAKITLKMLDKDIDATGIKDAS